MKHHTLQRLFFIGAISLIMGGAAYSAEIQPSRAKQIRIDDASSYYVGTTVEAALAEIGAGTAGPFLKLDQTASQDIINGQPDFLAGLRAGSTNQLSIDASGNVLTTGTGTFDSLLVNTTGEFGDPLGNYVQFGGVGGTLYSQDTDGSQAILNGGGIAGYFYDPNGNEVYLCDGNYAINVTIGDAKFLNLYATRLNLTATSNQIVLQSLGVTTTLTESGATTNKVINFPNFTGTLYISGGTDVAVADGGTNLSLYAVGDLITASGTTTLARIADVAAGSYLRSGGAGVIPLWSTLILPNAATQYQIAYATALNTYGADAGLTYDDSTDLLTVTDSLTVSGGTVTTDGLTLTGQISQTGITGASSTSGSTGSSVTLRGGTGGAGTAGSGGSGGDVILAAASGGAASKTSAMVTGGSASAVGSTGSSGGSASGSSTCTSATGGKGSSVEFYSGAGGSASNTNTASTGGDAGNILLSGYPGGVSTTASGTIHTGGKGSAILISSGTGGAASGGSTSNTGGAGGSQTYTAGIGGTGATANGANGDFIWKSGTTEIARFDNTAGTVGRFGIGIAPTAWLTLKAGSATAGTAPTKWTPVGAVLNTAPEIGAWEPVTDDISYTIATGTARKQIVMTDGTLLVTGRVPYTGTNGRLLSTANLLYAGTDLTLASTNKFIFNASTEYINSANAGHLDLNAATSIDLNVAVVGSSTIDCTGYKVATVAGVDMASGTPKGVTVSKGIITAATSVTPAADGTYCTGLKLTPVTGTDGSITISGGIITAITAAT